MAKVEPETEAVQTSEKEPIFLCPLFLDIAIFSSFFSLLLRIPLIPATDYGANRPPITI
ncbi:hypothetical protein [Candidatus Hakubella thermalkaliphila]|uniref:hypothetical protein n=1 Tax=Candidatus Hakubella thermalkaliphila TaxID=2754717 RepID=UPI001594E0FD|nr:hypothetical protein [Candidatus Hakubella thermalkaliphila]